jgi:hypothetical protein
MALGPPSKSANLSAPTRHDNDAPRGRLLATVECDQSRPNFASTSLMVTSRARDPAVMLVLASLNSRPIAWPRGRPRARACEAATWSPDNLGGPPDRKKSATSRRHAFFCTGTLGQHQRVRPRRRVVSRDVSSCTRLASRQRLQLLLLEIPVHPAIAGSREPRNDATRSCHARPP